MMVAGFVDPTSGDVRIAGVSMLGVPPERRGLGMVFQDYALFPHLTVQANVSFPLEMRKVRGAAQRNAVASMVELLGLSGLERRYPAQLSGGQKQRVALARALVFEPSLLLMDEPLGALDKQLRERMQHELRRLHRELGTTVLYVTHDQREALTLSDRVAVMRSGRIVQVASPEELYREPSNRFVAAFIGACNFLAPDSCSSIADNVWEVAIGPRHGRARGRGPGDGEGPLLAIRPHHFRIELDDSDGLPGRITDLVFLGDTIEYLVLTARGESVTVVTQAAGSALSIGREVHVTWPWEEVSLL
jgi:putative spermidine/putrescine transport system ATP-binding protein